MAGSCEYGWLNTQRADGRCARDTMMMMMISGFHEEAGACHRQLLTLF